MITINPFVFVKQSLIGHWPMSGNANDESGSGNNGVVTGATLTTDKNGVSNSAYLFSGTNQYITIGDKYDLIDGDLSVSVWCYPTTITGIRGIVSKTIFAAQTGRWSIYQNNNTFAYGIEDADGSNKGGSVTFTSDAWYHLVMVIKRGSSVYFYVNNVKYTGVGGVVYSTTFNTNNILRFGSYNASDGITPANFFAGKIDNVRIYNVALTDSDVSNLFSNYL